MYCGTPTKRGKTGEHIVPKALGGARTLNATPNRAVCQQCNSGPLSRVDNELSSRSYLSMIASQRLSPRLWQAWDVDHGAHNLLVEARPAWHADESLNSLVAYPQITFERTGPELRGDAEEMVRFGREDFAKVLFKAARRCFDRYCAGEKALHLEHVRSGVTDDGYRLAPRIFSPHSIFEIVRDINLQSFILRFASQEGKRFGLLSLSKLDAVQPLKNWSQKIGSRYPTFSFYFDVGDSLRGLMKIGLNLIAAYCPNTPVSPEAFGDPIRVILGQVPIPPAVMVQNGFVHAEDVACIKGNANEHSFRLAHVRGVWHVYFCFFGGGVGAYVRIPGPTAKAGRAQTSWPRSSQRRGR
jgi:hypothetical protein